MEDDADAELGAADAVVEDVLPAVVDGVLVPDGLDPVHPASARAPHSEAVVISVVFMVPLLPVRPDRVTCCGRAP